MRLFWLAGVSEVAPCRRSFERYGSEEASRRWANLMDHIDPDVYARVAAVEDIAMGSRRDVREPEPVVPVSDEVYRATLPHLVPKYGDVLNPGNGGREQHQPAAPIDRNQASVDATSSGYRFGFKGLLRCPQAGRRPCPPRRAMQSDNYWTPEKTMAQQTPSARETPSAPPPLPATAAGTKRP